MSALLFWVVCILAWDQFFHQTVLISKLIIHQLIYLLVMLKSQFEITDIYSDESDIDDQIVLKIESTDPRWAHFFLNASASDLKIRHRQLIYPGHRNIMFKNINLHALELQSQDGYLQIPQNLNPELVQGVLSCLYSLQLKICRSYALEILDIVHCLHISKLKRQIQDDIKTNFQDYEIFPLLQKSINFDLGQVKELCLNAFQSQCYEQVRYGKYDLLNCTQVAFKFVISHHNERKWEQLTFGLSEKYMQQLIAQYCKHNNYSQRAKNKLIKQLGQLAIKTQFPSFSKIKPKPLRNDFQSQSPLQNRLYTPRSFAKEASVNFKYFSEPPFHAQCSSTKSMIVDLTYMGDRKRKCSRSSENNSSQSKLCSDIICLKELNREMQDEMEQMNQLVQKLDKSMKQKEGQHRNMTFKVAEVQSLLEESQKQLMEQSKKLFVLDIKLGKVIMNQINQSQGVFDQQFDNIRGSGSSAESEEERGQYKLQKSQNKKDENLRVSLIESKWVCC